MNECSTETVWLGGPPMGQGGPVGKVRVDAAGRRVVRPARVVSR